MDTQADLSLRWAHTHFVDFIMSWLKLSSNTHLICFSDFSLPGVGCSAEGIANMMQEAMTNFTKNNVVKNLQEVRIVVFQKDIVSPFIGAMKDAVEGTGINSIIITVKIEKNRTSEKML